MAGYKSSEIESVVSGFVKSKLTISQSPLGPTDADSKFTEVVELFASTLIYDPNAIFYLIYLASNRLNVEVLALLDVVEDLLTAVGEMGKHTTDVTNTAPLGDAASSLLTVDQLLTNQSTISSAAYARYRASVDKFIQDSLKTNIKKGTQIVRPPQLARSDAKTDLASLATAWPELLEKVSQVRAAFGEFQALNLPVVAAQGSVQKIRSDLQELQKFFDSKDNTRDDRIAKCREAYLRLAAGKAVLDNYTTVTDPTDPRLSSSSSIVGRVATPEGDLGEFVNASVTTGTSGPWEIDASHNTIILAEDGNAPTTYVLSVPDKPSLTGIMADTYDIVASTNDLMEIDGLPILVTLTTGTGRSASNIASDINTWSLANYSSIYVATVVTASGKNYVKIEKSVTGVQRLIMTADDATYEDRVRAAYATLGFYEGEQADAAGISASGLMDVLNTAGKVVASMESTTFEEGTTGVATSATVFDIPVNTLASLVHAGDQLLVRTGRNAGYHRISSITRGATDRVILDSATPLMELSGGQSWIIVRDLVKIASELDDLDSEIVVGSGTANGLMGLIAGTYKATTTGFRAAKSGTDVDFSKYDVVAGDILNLSDSNGRNTLTILELSDSNTQLEFDPPLAGDFATTSFEILSKAAADYETFELGLDAWIEVKDGTDFAETTLELDRVMNPLLVNKQPSSVQIADARSVVEDFHDLVESLSLFLVAFVVKAVSRIDAALKMLKERGMDRAYDFLMQGQIADFFAMDKDDAASSAHMLKSMRAVARTDLPVSKLDDDAGDTAVSATIPGTDANFDYSDQDTDANMRILGEVPDFYKSGDADSTYRKRF